MKYIPSIQEIIAQWKQSAFMFFLMIVVFAIMFNERYFTEDGVQNELIVVHLLLWLVACIINAVGLAVMVKVKATKAQEK